MITTIRPKGKKLEFTTQATISDENIKKLEDENIQKRVHAWEKDNNVLIFFNVSYNKIERAAEGNVCIVSTVPTGDQNTIKKMEETTIEFLKWIDSVELSKQIPDPANQEQNEEKSQDDKDIQFVKELLDAWDETEDLAQTVGAVIMCKMAPGINVPYGRISERLLKKMCISFLKIREA